MLDITLKRFETPDEVRTFDKGSSRSSGSVKSPLAERPMSRAGSGPCMSAQPQELEVVRWNTLDWSCRDGRRSGWTTAGNTSCSPVTCFISPLATTVG